MSFVENNPLLKGHRGMLGGTLVFRQVNGRTVISARPKKREKPTEHQIKTKEKFLLAVDYARLQMTLPEIKALYQKAIGKKIPNAYTAALKDFLNAPVVREINTNDYTGKGVNDMIYVVATDDFEVISVTIEIYSAAGTLVEKGEMQERDLHRNGWEYASTVVNNPRVGSRIVVTAKDRPGNTTSREQVL